MVRRVAREFHSMVDIVTGDAGLMCRENAALIRGLNKHYLLTVKGNQQALFATAEHVFGTTTNPPKITTTERRNGATLTRTLDPTVVKDAVGGIGIYGAEELWRIEQVTESDAGERTTEVRHFISSLPSRTLSPTRKLQFVRLHWGIENNRGWTLDAIFEEDDRQPCQLSRRSVEVVCWLRELAYNLVATLRSGAKQKDRRAQPWRRTMQRLRDLLVSLSTEDLTAILT